MFARSSRIVLLLGWLALPVATLAQEEEKPAEKQELSAYDALWKQAENLLKKREYAAARRLLESRRSNADLAGDQEALDADLHDIRLLEKLKERIVAKCKRLKEGDAVTINGTPQVVVRYDVGLEQLVVQGGTEPRTYKLSAISPPSWVSLADQAENDEGRYQRALVYALEKYSDKDAKRLFEVTAASYPQGDRWLKRFEAAQAEAKRKREEEIRKKKEEEEKRRQALAEKDPFKVGATFTGSRSFTRDPKIVQQVTLEVTKRDGVRFEGELTIADTGGAVPLVRKLKVRGTAPQSNQGRVVFTNVKQGLFLQTFTGNYAEGAIGFRFQGSADNGNPVDGKGVIR